MKATCDFCFRECTIEEGKTGWCHARKCKDGKLTSLAYSAMPAIAIDPIEKKPLYHFLPGSVTLSFGASGCNFNCDFCQNWQLSQRHENGEKVSISTPSLYAKSHNIPSISYTYSEPLVWQDWMIESAENATELGIKNVMVSNGSFSKSALERTLPWLDAFNIDLKGDETFYRNICHGEMKPVINAIETIAERGKHIEVTTMLIEGIHDEAMIEFLGKELNARDIKVWHLSRFYPQYKMNNLKPTSELYLNKMIQIAKESNIPYIYAGNSVLKNETRCPSCGKVIRERPGEIIQDGRCKYCGNAIYGVWK